MGEEGELGELETAPVPETRCLDGGHGDGFFGRGVGLRIGGADTTMVGASEVSARKLLGIVVG